MSDERMRLYEWLLAQEGCPYVWGGKGEFHDIGGGIKRPAYDCSGLVTCAIRKLGGPDWRHTHNAARLFDVLEPTEEDELFPFDLAFYGKHGVATHVMFAFGDGRAYGACDGGRRNMNAAASLQEGAKVKFRDAINYRNDFMGYRRFPLPH